jgi:superfamily I DNA/RNA helicase
LPNTANQLPDISSDPIARGSVVGPELSDVDGNTENRRGTISVFNGAKPTVMSLATPEEEIKTVSEWLSERISDDNLLAHEIGIFVRSTAQLDRSRAAVEGAGLSFKVLDEKVETTSGYVSISTMHLAKGPEFREVVVNDEDEFPERNSN